MLIYLDESGDLGFSEGSSKVFVISFVTMDRGTSLKLKRKVKKVKEKRKIPLGGELKASKSKHSLRVDILSAISSLPVEIRSITVKKHKINESLRGDTNILYNYMVNLIMVPYLKGAGFNEVEIVADLRITKVAKGLRFSDYLKYKLIFEQKVYDMKLNIQFLDSLRSNCLQAVDFVAHSVFRKHEVGDARYFRIIEGRVAEDGRLFF